MEQLIYPDATQWVDAAEAGHRAGMIDRRQTAATDAGGMMASGDYKGAAAALYKGGDIAGGSQIAQAGYTQETEAAKLATKTAVQQALANGDFAGAYQAASTEPELLADLDKVTAHAKQTTSDMAAALQSLKGPDGKWLPDAEAAAKYAQIKPQLAARGVDAKMLDGFVPTAANLDAIQGQVLGLKEQLDMHKPVVVDHNMVDPVTHQVVYKGSHYEKVGPDETLLDVGGGGAPGPQMTTPEAPTPTGGVYDHVGQVASAKGATPQEVAYLQRLAQVESHGEPSAQNGKSTGVFQFHPDTFAALGGKDISSVDQQTAAALALQKRDRANLQQIGIEPTDANAYIMHQQGAGGGRALLTAPPEINAVSVLTPIYGSAKIAEKAIVGNGGTPDMTAGDFVGMWRQRWANGGAPVPHAGGNPQGTAPQDAASGAVPSNGPRVIFKGAPKDDGSVPLTDSARKLLAGKFIQTGVVPPFGQGTKGSIERDKFYNEAAAQADELHLSAADLVSGAATTKALGASLTQMQKSLEATQSYEQTALANGDLMMKLAPKGAGQTNIPVVNRWLQAGRKQIAGDPDVTAFDNAIGAYSEEYAKVMTGNLGNVAATDGARKDAAERLGKYAAQGQLAKGYEVMKQEMENRNHAQEAQVAGIQKKLRSGAYGDSPTTDTTTTEAPAKTPPAGRTPAQQQAVTKFTDYKAQPGSTTNPVVPVSEAQYNKLAPGTHYIHADGSVRVKGG